MSTYAPLVLATDYAKTLGLTSITIHPGEAGFDPTTQYREAEITTTPVARLYPGAVAKLKGRLWHAIQDHRRSFGEPSDLADEDWTLIYVKTGPDTAAWQLRHASCRTMRRAA